MGMEYGKMKMNNTKVTTNQIKSKVLVFINGRINKSIKDSSEMIIDKDMENYTKSVDSSMRS